MVYSASSARTLLEGQGDGTAYLVKYLAYGAVGLGVMQLLARHGLAHVRRFTPLLLMARSSCCCSSSSPASASASTARGAGSAPGPLQFQPAEIMKLALVLHASAVLSAPAEAHRPAPHRRPIFLPGGCAVLLIAAQPDLGTALVICFTLAAMLVAAGLPIRQLVWSRRPAPCS